MVKLQAGAPGSLVVVAFVRTVCLGEVVVLVGILGTLSVLCWRCCAWQVTSFETIQVHQRFQEADSSSKVSTAPEVIDPQRETQGPMRLMQCSSRDRIGVQVPRYSTPL